jgi:hypothetical protein
MDFDLRDFGFGWMRPYYRQMSQEPGFIGMDVASRWTALRRKLLSTDQPDVQTLLAAMDRIPPVERPAFLQWLRMPG